MNITPRRDNASRHFNDYQHDNVDANSCDQSEMSEDTDPTFSSSLIMQTTKGKNVVNKSDSCIKENHNMESSQHKGGRIKNLAPSSISASLIDKQSAVKGEVNVVPPFVSLDTIESSDDEREDKSRGLVKIPRFLRRPDRHGTRSRNHQNQ